MDLAKAIDRNLEPKEDSPIDATWNDEEVYQGETVWELDGELFFDELEKIEEYLLHIGAIRRVSK